MMDLIGLEEFQGQGCFSGGFLRGQTDPEIVLGLGLLPFRKKSRDFTLPETFPVSVSGLLWVFIISHSRELLR